MSVPDFSPGAAPAAWLAALRERLRISRERRLVWVRGSATFTQGWVDAAIAEIDRADLLRVGPAGGESVTPDQARHYLGREFDVLVWDARAGLHPDGFGALAGTLRGGGVLILTTPESKDWPRFDDPDYRRLGSPPEEKHFLARLARILLRTPTVLRINADAGLPPLPEAGPALPVTLPTPDQQRALTAIFRVRQGHRCRPLVITADRGRGKSAALGIAAGKLLRQAHLGQAHLGQPRLKIIVTAPRPGALTSFWQHAGAQLPGAVQEPAAMEREEGGIRFVPPARLLEVRPEADLLLVDEAAAIPVPILRALLERYARVVFASTVHGYEGSGRGFTLRFQDHLNTMTPHWQALTLSQPVRWASTDPLEPLLNELLLLDAELAPISAAPCPKKGTTKGAAKGKTNDEVELIHWPRSERVHDEKRLREVFGLLVNAHYQTTPDDLRLLLDDESSHCWLAIREGSVIGAVWAMAEGGLPESLAVAVRRGLRRTRGHLLPQALAAYGGDAEAATLCHWRLVRVAVHPGWRRRGLGQRLVAAAMSGAGEAHADVFGTSFGLSPELVGFWQRCGLRALRLGMRSDAASGAPSMMLGQGLSAAGDAMCERQRGRFAEHWPTLLATELQVLDPAVVWALNGCWAPPVRWSAQDALEVADFATGARPLALSRLPLQRLSWLCQAGLPQALGADAALWCRAVLQQVPESGWRAEGLVSGRKAGYNRLRDAAGKLLALVRVAQ